MQLNDNEIEIIDKISAITNQPYVSDEEIQEAKRLINTLPEDIRVMYDEALFLIENDETR
jgi:hypothetical protein